MNQILDFLESINDGEVHQLRNKNAFAALDGKNDEVVMILKLRKQGLVDITEGFVHGSPAITGYYITDKGQKYIKDHTSKKLSNKIKKNLLKCNNFSSNSIDFSLDQSQIRMESVKNTPQYIS